MAEAQYPTATTPAAPVEPLPPFVSQPNLFDNPVPTGSPSPLATAERPSQHSAPAPSQPAGPATPGPLADVPLSSLAPPPVAPNPMPSNQIDPAALYAATQQQIANQFAITDAWKPKGKVQFVIDLPSGQRILATHLDPLDMVEAGIAEELDYFSRKLFPANLSPAGDPIETEVEEQGPNSAVWKLLSDTQKRVRFIQLLNKLCAQAVNRPKVIDDGVEVGRDEDGKIIVVYGASAVVQVGENQTSQLFPKPIQPLKDGQVYASYIDFQDKMAIFDALNQPLGMIQPFRESPSGVPSVESSQSVGSETV